MTRYSPGKIAYKLWDETHKKVLVSKNGKVDEWAEENKIVPEDQTMSSEKVFSITIVSMYVFKNFTKNSIANPSLHSRNNADLFQIEDIIFCNDGISESGGYIAV